MSLVHRPHSHILFLQASSYLILLRAGEQRRVAWKSSHARRSESQAAGDLVFNAGKQSGGKNVGFDLGSRCLEVKRMPGDNS